MLFEVDPQMEAPSRSVSDESDHSEAEAGTDDVSTESLPGVGDGNSDANALEMDDIFHVLQNERRRNVLRYLEDVDEVIEMRDMAEQIAAWENDTTVQQLHSDQRQRVYIALYQSHLPKMDGLGLINYNKPRGYVEPQPRLEEVQQYLNPQPAAESAPAGGNAAGSETDGRTELLGTAGVAALVVAAGWAGLFAPLLSGMAVATAVFALFTITIAYTYRSGLSQSRAEH